MLTRLQMNHYKYFTVDACAYEFMHAHEVSSECAVAMAKGSGAVADADDENASMQSTAASARPSKIVREQRHYVHIPYGLHSMIVYIAHLLLIHP